MMEEHMIERVILEGFPYEIDRKNEVLLPREIPRPAISFSAMQKEGDFYVVAINGTGDIVPEDEDRWIAPELRIPAVLLNTGFALDSDGLADFNRRSYDNDWGVLVYDHAITERLTGKLPQIDINGDFFTVDLRLKELRNTREPETILSLENCTVTRDGKLCLGYYNTVLKKQAEIGNGITELPRNVVLLKIPNELILDPVAVAQNFGLIATELLPQHPIKDNLRANLVPLTKTQLPKLVEINRRIIYGDSQSQRPKI